MNISYGIEWSCACASRKATVAIAQPWSGSPEHDKLFGSWGTEMVQRLVGNSSDPSVRCGLCAPCKKSLAQVACMFAAYHSIKAEFIRDFELHASIQVQTDKFWVSSPSRLRLRQLSMHCAAHSSTLQSSLSLLTYHSYDEH